MILDELTLYLKELLLSGNGKLSPMIIERFFRVIAESKSLLALGSDGEFVLSLSLFKMMEALEIKDIDTMIRGLERELKGVEVSEIMVTTPVPDVSAPTEVITITEEEIIATLPTPIKKEETITARHSELDSESPQDSHTTEEAKEILNQVQDDVEKISETIKKESPTIEEQPNKIDIPEPVTPQTDPHQKTFDSLVKKIYDRNYDLGACFERNIEFESFIDNKLTWCSSAEGYDKKQLITHWGLINMFVKELFGFETKIVNITKKKTITVSSNSLRQAQGTHIKSVAEPVEAPHQDADSGSMIEDIEMKSSCISPDAGETEAAKEKDPSTLLEEPMIKEAIALFDPKKVRIKRNT
jgi:DNA polymerase-3 subunit gamma/tau